MRNIFWIILTLNTQALNSLKNMIKTNLSFLDVKVTPRDNQLVTSVFRKAAFSVAFTNFKSFLPVPSKFGLDRLALRHRYFSICSSFEKFQEEIV